VHDRPWRTYEHIFMFSKNREYDFDNEPLKAANERDVWTIKSQSKAGREHPAVFPHELVQRCLDIGHKVGKPTLDPFAGSGTVLRVATAAGIPADGIDLSPTFCSSMASTLGRQH
jgi:DNA modification methylase